MADSTHPPAPHRSTLTLRDICTALVTGGEINQEDAERVLSANIGIQTGGSGPASQRHPLELVAKAGLESQKTGRTLDLDRLTQWLAEWAEQPYYLSLIHI